MGFPPTLQLNLSAFLSGFKELLEVRNALDWAGGLHNTNSLLLMMYFDGEQSTHKNKKKKCGLGPFEIVHVT